MISVSKSDGFLKHIHRRDGGFVSLFFSFNSHQRLWITETHIKIDVHFNDRWDVITSNSIKFGTEKQINRKCIRSAHKMDFPIIFILNIRYDSHN